MKKLSKEKRQQLALVVILTVAVLSSIWFGLINAQKKSLDGLVQREAAAAQELKRVKQAIESADDVEAALAETGKRLSKIEDAMASGDLYSWAITTLRQFKSPYSKVDLPQFSQIDGPKDVPVIPKFPYKQAGLTIGGTAQFYDLGRFIADFENQFPYMRVLNLSLEPTAAGSGEEKEKLNFRMEIAALVKPD